LITHSQSILHLSVDDIPLHKGVDAFFSAFAYILQSVLRIATGHREPGLCERQPFVLFSILATHRVACPYRAQFSKSFSIALLKF